MYKPLWKIVLVFSLLGLMISACGSFGPPQSCGDNIGGTADQAKYAQSFSSMQLINQTTGLTGTEGENGTQFTSSDNLAIQAGTLSNVNIRVCVQHTDSTKPIPFDQTRTLSQGQTDFSIGQLEAGNYVIRVIVDNILVKNFPFEIK
jgi:hypothetical protein